MKIAISTELTSSECVVVPFFEGKEKAVVACQDRKFSNLAPIHFADFRGELGETTFFYESTETRYLLLGLGKEDKVTEESIRRASASALKACQKKKISQCSIFVPKISSLSIESLVQALLEGLFLSSYRFDRWKTDDKKAQNSVENIILLGIDKSFQSLIHKVEKISAGVHFARDLVNSNADQKTPRHLSEIAKSLEKYSSNLQVTILEKSEIEREKMGLLLAVNQASAHEPTFTILRYMGNKESSDHTVIIGKGIVFDTGGLCIKTPSGMETQKADMSGAAVVLGTIMAIASLGLPINVTGVFPATDNAIGSKAFRPGDIARSFSGKTVEILNTDAEGRLILADALAYSMDRLHPTRVIDLATLTGAITVALGDDIAGLFSNNDELASRLEKSSSRTGELVWRLPLHEEYRRLYKSDIADLKNVGPTGKGSSITAALFLQEFVKEGCPWAHVDIANVALLNEPRHYCSTRGTAVGVRLLVDFLEGLIEK